jgi:uncharacterized membrane protein
MFLKLIKNPKVLIFIGIIGMSLFKLIEKNLHIPMISDDILKGLWYGFFIGVALVGIVKLGKQKKRWE